MRIILKGIILTILISSGKCDLNFNETLSEEIRQPRVSGRIVKLYSGTRPEPFLCPAEGFQADPTNCAVFYRCVGAANGKFTVFRFQCGPGTIYDPETEICNYPSSTKRSECGGRNPGVGQENEVEGNQSAFKPNFEQKVTSAYPWATSKPQLQSESTISTSNPLLSNGPNRKPSQDGDPCTTTGFMGDSENCRKFYRCVGNQRGRFIRYEFMCSENTIWDDDAQSCNHPWAVQKRSCGRGLSREPSDSDQSTDHIFSPSNTIQQQTQISYGNKVTQTQTQISNGSAIQNQTQINYGDRFNKEFSGVLQNQTQISSGSAVSQAQTQINYGNKGMQSQLQVDHSQLSSQAQTVQYDENDSSNGENLVTNQESLPNKENNGNECTESGFMGDKEDCKKFYRCVDNGKGGFIKYEFTCGEGTVWDSSIEACNHAWAVKECGGKRPTESESQSGSQSTTQSSQVTFEETTTTETNKDNNCTQNQSPSTTMETKPVTTTAKHPSPEDDKCTSSGFKGDVNDCKRFYRCVDNGNGGYTRYEFSCGEGTLWDQSIEACNHAWAVKDCNGTDSGLSQPQTETTSSSTTTNVSEQETTFSMTTEKPETSSNTHSWTESTQHSDDVCKNEGFFGDSKYCKKFYRCVDNGKGGYIKYEFTCGEGTVWDSEINTCNYESPNRKCSQGQSTGTSTETVETAATVNDEIITESPSDSPTTTQKQETQTSQKPHSSKECTQEGFYGDVDDCKKFYRCVDNGKGGYTKYEFTCGEGTVWDQEIQTCNYESNTNCSKSSASPISETQTESSGSSSTTTSSSETEKTTLSSETSSTLGDICTSEGYYANSKDCKKFYRCVDNGKGAYTKYDFSCGEGTVWVQEIQTCDHDNGQKKCTNENSNHQVSSTTTETSEKEPNNSSPVSSTTPSDKQDDETPDNSSKPPSSSDDTCNSEGFYANQQDCKRFYRCVDNGKGGYTKYDFECGEGTAWDNGLQTCNHENEVESCAQQNGESTSKPVMKDEETNQSTESSSSTTSSSSSSSQSSTSQNKDKCTQEGYYGNTEDCKKFYRCVDNGKGGFTKYDFDCGEGTIWDQDLTTCNHPQDVSNPSCNQSSSSQGESSSTTSSSSTSESSTQKSSTTSSSSTSESSTQKTSTTTEATQGSSNCSQDNSSKKPANNNVNCTKAGYYPNPDDCKKFYRCVDWDGDGTKFSVFHFECGEGTIWDPSLDTCNHEDSVYPPRNCSKSQSENTNEQTTSTTEGTTTESDGTTTTEQSSEQTTQAQEQSTTEHSGTTTQSSTTSEQTTTQRSTTSQQTTTQRTTTEKSTTEQTETSESSTTQQTTSSEQTTSQQTTSSEQTTAQQTTSSEPTTAQQTTSSEPTTAQQTTSSEPTTAQQTTTDQTTSEHSTSQQTTMEQTTSQQTTMQMTTKESTDHETTTQSSATDSTTDKNDQHTTEQTTEGTTQDFSEQSTTNETNEMTTEGSSTSSTEESSTTESSSSSEKECPETDDDQHLFVCPSSFKRHPKYCNLFYQCDEDDDNHDVKIAVFHCPNNTIYDENQTKCVEESKANKKCNGQIAQRRRLKRLDTIRKEPIIVSTKSMKCPTTGYFPIENEECSAGFLKCQSTKSGKLNGLIHRCPESHVYWSISKRCEPEYKMRFCKRSFTDWNGRWEIPVERRNVAPQTL